MCVCLYVYVSLSVSTSAFLFLFFYLRLDYRLCTLVISSLGDRSLSRLVLLLFGTPDLVHRQGSRGKD